MNKMVDKKSAKMIMENEYPDREVMGGGYDKKRNAYRFTLPYVKGNISDSGKVFSGLVYFVNRDNGKITSKHFMELIEEDE